MEVNRMDNHSLLLFLIVCVRILLIRNAGKQRRKIHNSKLSKELFSDSKLRNFDKKSALIRLVIQCGFFAFNVKCILKNP